MGARHFQSLRYYLRRDAEDGETRATVSTAAPPAGAVGKIAVLRANALGDFIFTLPALEALRRRYPAAEIVLLGNPWHHAFLAGRPCPVDRVIVVPKCDGIPHQSHRVENPAEVEDFFGRMRGERFDIAFQMHGGGRHSNPFVRKLGARLAVGMRDRDAIPLDISVPYWRHQSEVLRYLEVVKTVGAAPVRLEPRIAVTPADAAELAAGLGAREPEFPYAVLHPGASDRCRRWPPEKFARVGDTLAEAGLHVYVCGTAAERAITAEVTRRMHVPADDLSGRVSLNAYCALLSGAEILVSNDTGPLHLARAIGTRTVGIYWIVNLVTGNSVIMERHRNCIAWNIYCPGCGADCLRADMKPVAGCAHDVSLVDEVSVEEVLGCAFSLLGGSSVYS